MFAVLLYHGLDSGEAWDRGLTSTDREYVLDRRRFEQHIAYLTGASTRICSLNECRVTPVGSDSGAPRVALTFDDGDLSCYTTAAPLLERAGFRAEFFVVSQWIDRPGFLTRAQLRDLVARGHRIQSHSRTHPMLPTLQRSAIEDEVMNSKQQIEDMIGAPVNYFSVPNGALDSRVVDAAGRAGYAAVLSSVEGYNNQGQSAFVLRRFAARSYTSARQLSAICEWPRCTAARITVKRYTLSAAKRMLGGQYERLRQMMVSRMTRGQKA
jgi:peptidoglycan/xylan/chitin deacetylase (PgdA/CDA1 family)